MTRKDMPMDPAQFRIAIKAAIQDLVEEGRVRYWPQAMVQTDGRYETVWHTPVSARRSIEM